ncbi:hypothetical protein LguiA_022557 [Lonicera macranthoides]
MASESQPEKKKQKFDEEVEKVALLDPTRGGDDGKTEEETPNDDNVEDAEEEEYDDDDDDVDEVEYIADDDEDLDKPIPHIPYYSSEEDCDSEEYKEYRRIINESKGFTVPPRPKGVRIAATGPVQVVNPECLDKFAKYALVWYKKTYKEDAENYELLRVDRANAMPDRGILYYITFVARAVGASCDVTFQAKVLNGLNYTHEVDSCEIVPNGS